MKQVHFRKAVAFSLLFAATTIPARAQLKAGSNHNTISANTNLEVEAENGVKLRVNKDNGNVGIGTSGAPAAQLHIANTGTQEPLKIEGLQPIAANLTNAAPLMIDPATGLVKTAPMDAFGGAGQLIVHGRNGGVTGTMAAITSFFNGAARRFDIPAQINIGNVWNQGNAAFTAPSDGRYLFYTRMTFKYNKLANDAFDGSRGYLTSCFRVNPVPGNLQGHQEFMTTATKDVYKGAYSPQNGDDYYVLPTVFTLSLKQGDKVEFGINQGNMHNLETLGSVSSPSWDSLVEFIRPASEIRIYKQQ